MPTKQFQSTIIHNVQLARSSPNPVHVQSTQVYIDNSLHGIHYMHPVHLRNGDALLVQLLVRDDVIEMSTVLLNPESEESEEPPKPAPPLTSKARRRILIRKENDSGSQ